MFARGGATGPGRSPGLGLGLLQLVGGLSSFLFALLLISVVLFTLLASSFSPADHLLRPSPLLNSSESPFIHLSDIPSSSDSTPTCDPDSPIDCADPEVFHSMMRAAIERFPDVHFYRFGKPAFAPAGCDIAYRFRPRDSDRPTFYKDYRRYRLARAPDCSLSVLSIGDYHSGVNARKQRKNKKPLAPTTEPVIGEAVNDMLPTVPSESTFSRGRYLLYAGGGDRCKSMNHFLWGFLCALGEAQYLNRTLVMDTTVCLSAAHTASGLDEEGKDFRFYFDFEHLRDSASVLDQREFWANWGKWQVKDGLRIHLVEDFRVTPVKLDDVTDTLVLRKFGSVEPDNYWYRVCEGETEAVVQRPWHLIRKSRRLLDIVSGIASRMNWDFDTVHVVRGEKARNTQLWPNLATDTSPNALLATLGDKIDDSRQIYVATNEPDKAFFDPLKDKYTVRFLDDFKDLWDENSEWYMETMKLNNNVPVEFDGYMRLEVDTEVFFRGKKQIETFNDLTSDCKDGVGTCHPSSS